MDLQRLAHLLRKSWLVLLVFVAAGVGLGAAQNQLSPPKYSSDTTLLFSLSSKGTLSALADGNTYIQAMMPSLTKVIETPLVLDPVINRLDLNTTPKQLAHSVEVDYQIDSVIADVAVSDADPERAAAIANAIAEQMVSATTTLAPPGAAGDLGQISVGQISAARSAASPYSPRLLPHLVVGLLGGLVLGIAVVLLREALFSSAVNNRDAVARATTAPLLGTFPLDPKSRSRPLPADTQPTLPRAEAFRFMESNLAHVVPGAKLCVVVTSARADEGRTTTAANLAISIALANANRRVLLIDADLRSADIDDLLGVYSSLGLTSVVTNRTPLEEAVVPWTLHRADDPQISFLSAGPPVPEPSDLLASESMSRLIRQARELYDVVILDSAPLLDVTDGAILAAQADGAVIVVDSQKTRHRHLTESLARLRLAGAHVIGVVLNRMPETKEARRPGSTSAGHDINVRRRAPIFGAPGEEDPGLPIPGPDEAEEWSATPQRPVTPGRPLGGSDPFLPPVRVGAPATPATPATPSNPATPTTTTGEDDGSAATERPAGVQLYPSFPNMLPVGRRPEDIAPPTRPTDLSELIEASGARAPVNGGKGTNGANAANGANGADPASTGGQAAKPAAAKPEPAPKTESDAKSESDPKTEPESKTRPDAKPDAKAEADAKAEPSAKTDPPAPKSDPTPKADPATKVTQAMPAGPATKTADPAPKPNPAGAADSKGTENGAKPAGPGAQGGPAPAEKVSGKPENNG